MTELILPPLHDVHLDLGARMGAFAGWEMPISYQGVLAEHRAVRTAAGLFDLSHLGRLLVTGPDAEAVVQAAFSNDVTAIVPGQAQYTLCLAEDAGILDDLIVYRLADRILVVPNAANTEVVAERLRRCAEGRSAGVASLDVVCLAVQGPDAAEACRTVGLDAVEGLQYMEVVALSGNEVVSRTGYTGEVGFELFLHPDRARRLWGELLAVGVTPCGLGARDSLRLEMGYPLHGSDIGPHTTPVEARLGWAVKPGTGFVGEAAFVAAKEAGAARRLLGLLAEGRRAPRHGDAVVAGEVVVGEVTSGMFSPTLERAVALAYLDAGIDVGAHVAVDVRGKPVDAEVVRPPFVDASPR